MMIFIYLIDVYYQKLQCNMTCIAFLVHLQGLRRDLDHKKASNAWSKEMNQGVPGSGDMDNHLVEFMAEIAKFFLT